MDSKKFTFVGPSCGHHASYTFYKAIKYQQKTKNGTTKQKVLGLGEFFFVKIWSDSDLVSIGEVQLFWEDKNTNQILSSLRLYFLPEYTPEGRMGWHGEDEVVAVSEKAVLKVTDLLDWIADPSEVGWDRGVLGLCAADCKTPTDPNSKFSNNPIYDIGLNEKFNPAYSDFLMDIRQEKVAIDDVPKIDELAVIILSSSQYSRYRAMLKRMSGREKYWMQNSLVAALGGFTVRTKRTYVVFCRENFDYPELEEHPYLCNHLAPKLKGRPRKRKKVKRPGSPESESASSESSVSTSVSLQSKNGRNGVKKDFLSILSQKNTKEELEFLKKLISFMEKRNSPIERPPMLGYKQIDLHLFYQKVEKIGGYDSCVSKKSWKSIYDELGGNPQNTSAATCTRKHYEKFLLPYERHLRSGGRTRTAGVRKINYSESNSTTDSEKDKMSKSDPDSPSARLDEDNLDTSNVTEGNPKDLAANGEDNDDESASKDEKLDEKSKVSDRKADNVEENGGEGTKKEDVEHKPESEAAKKLQIDDLIILPNQLSSPPEGQSALQNLAKIASRYQSKPDMTRDSRSVSPSKKRLMESEKGTPGTTQPLPATPGSAKKLPSAQTGAGASSASALVPPNNLLSSLLPPGLIPPWSSMTGSPGKSSSPGLTTGSPVSKSNPLAGLATAAGLGSLAGLIGDPSKLSSEALALMQLQYYEKHVKAPQVQQGGAAASSTPSAPSPSATSSPSPFKGATGRDSANSNASGSSASGSKRAESKERERIKACKLPPETKRPPSLMQTPCAFKQTTSIYTNPRAELTKLKNSSQQISSFVNNESKGYDALDLTRAKRPKLDPEPVINLKRESQLLQQPPPLQQQPTLDLSLKKESQLLANPKAELKSIHSPFSAEALLSKPSAKSSGSHHHPDLVKITPIGRSAMDDSRKRASPAIASHRGASPSIYGSGSQVSSTKSPWHTPVTYTSASITGSNKDGKPAIPVSPVVREDRKDGHSGLLPPSSTVTTPISLPLPASSFPMTSVSSFNHPSLSLAASNPYLALMSPGGPSSLAAAAKNPTAAAAAAASAYPAHLMDPATSAYYAALYSQQMYAGAAAGLGLTYPGAGIRPGLPPSGLDPLQAQALQAMLSGRNPSGSSSAGAGNAAAAAAAAAANSYAAAFPGIPGIPGYLGAYPPPRKDS